MKRKSSSPVETTSQVTLGSYLSVSKYLNWNHTLWVLKLSSSVHGMETLKVLFPFFSLPSWRYSLGLLFPRNEEALRRIAFGSA